MSDKTETLIIQFDSSAALLKNLACCLNNGDLKGVGVVPELPAWAGKALNAIPFKLRQGIYSWSGWKDAIKATDLEKLDDEDIARWVTAFYPQPGFNGVMFGSSNGAAIHLAAALNMPWLPQTYLAAVRRRAKPDDIQKDIEWGRKTIQPLLQKLPGIHAAQMHDPLQDRLMVSKMAYFRMKMVRIPEAFKQFIREHIGPQKPLITIECAYPWPTLQVQERHTFQLGGFGGIDPYEYLQGSDRIRDFLKRMKSPLARWETFQPTQESPEAEWGFYGQCLDEFKELAKINQAPFFRLKFDNPESLSAFTCDLYRWWYQKRLKVDSKRLLVENFALISPYRVLASAALPFWLVFNTRSSMRNLQEYLDHHHFEEIFLLLMSNGVRDAVDLTSMEDWKKTLKREGQKGYLVGIDEKKYPLDFATYMRYQLELRKFLPDQFQKPESLTMAEIKEFLAQNPQTYPLTLQEDH